MPVKTIAMNQLKGKKRTFYMDEHGGYRHEYVDFYPSELVEKIIEDLSNQVLEERRKWYSMFDKYKSARAKLRDARHDYAAKEKNERNINDKIIHTWNVFHELDDWKKNSSPGDYVFIFESCPSPQRIYYDGERFRDVHGHPFDMDTWKALWWTRWP